MPHPRLPHSDCLAWQADYARELQRTSGRTVTFQPLGGGWYRLVLDGNKTVFGKHRRLSVQQMTEALKTRPDYPAKPAP